MQSSLDDLGFGDNPTENIEAAKRLIARHPHVDVAALMATAADHAAPHSARLASIWTLGFVDDSGMSRTTLVGIVDDAGEADDIRDHATEALASITPSS